MAFRVGEIVQLRHGGPRMKVEKSEIRSGNEWVTCVWGTHNECHNYFAAEMLRKAEDPRETRKPAAEMRPTSLWQSLLSRFFRR